MTVRVAECRCGELTARCEGEPVCVSVCHCLACQRRTGSAFAAQARFPSKQVTISGEPRTYVRRADSGNHATYQF
ncbi:GFA family protein [Stigmatella sp. ncwal1]|uniref:GFA family protein n=1 Tax=Stigmatella ashevillensis TaxID=2995309 RepID=A0ABT5DGQ0_9BACT|nr:GFA family protein [Stigmatella ashevillena]MDC0712844.1 GFA family protein [Stigmatella ashevillena]